MHIRRWVPFVKYEFLPDPKGRFYGIGFGHLLGPLTEVLNTTINQLVDASTAQNAGGGFIASGLRLQGSGQNSVVTFRPGEYKKVNATGAELRNAIYERTLPTPSPVSFQLLELILGAAKELASIKDVLTGEAPSTAPVGTTLALIEQGLQGFTAIYKRIFRAEREEFQLLYECQRVYGSADDYAEVVDDPAADFEKDFAPTGKDIQPVSDPSVVTKMQALAKAQVIQQVAAAFPNALNMQAAAKRMFEAAEIDNPEELIAQPQPNPLMEAKTRETNANADLKAAQAMDATVEAGSKFGALHAADQGGVPGLAGAPGDAMGAPGGQGGGGGPEGGMAGPQLGSRGQADPLLLMELTTRADAYAALDETTYEQWCEANGRRARRLRNHGTDPEPGRVQCGPDARRVQRAGRSGDRRDQDGRRHLPARPEEGNRPAGGHQGPHRRRLGAGVHLRDLARRRTQAASRRCGVVRPYGGTLVTGEDGRRVPSDQGQGRDRRS
jgi:hypothetical protein